MNKRTVSCENFGFCYWICENRKTLSSQDSENILYHQKKIFQHFPGTFAISNTKYRADWPFKKRSGAFQKYDFNLRNNNGESARERLDNARQNRQYSRVEYSRHEGARAHRECTHGRLAKSAARGKTFPTINSTKVTKTFGISCLHLHIFQNISFEVFHSQLSYRNAQISAKFPNFPFFFFF